MKKRSHGRVSSRCSATWKRRSVIVSMSRSTRSRSSDRKFGTSTMYSPTSASISCFSAAGYVYCRFVSGVRKQETMTPFTGETG